MSLKDSKKLKLFRLIEILKERTDEKHQLTRVEICDILENEYDTEIDRKTFSEDIKNLIYDLDLDIVENKGAKNTSLYHLGEREFELSELKMLVDAVNSAKFISSKKSKDIIKKLGQFASNYEVRQLNRQMIVSDKIKTMNDRVVYTIDNIYKAIDSNRQIKFKYFRWNEKKEESINLKNGFYVCSPWALFLNDNNYYLIAYEPKSDKVKHFRVDKMKDTEILEDQVREGEEKFKERDIATYYKRVFNMFEGEQTYRVGIEATNYMANVLIDRFGKDIMMIPIDEKHFKTSVEVSVSPAFIGWIVGLGKGVKVVSPEPVVEMFKKEVERLKEQYS